MYRLCLLTMLLSLLPLTTAGAAPALPLAPPASAALVSPAKYLCGMFDGRFTCRYDPAGGLETGTKGAIRKTPEAGAVEQAPEGAATGAPASGAPAATDTACGRGMIGTPPDNCHCPESSELLGGNCVHYAARCTNGLAAGAVPQPCAGAEEKLACKMREDGLKDCCCLTYDKF